MAGSVCCGECGSRNWVIYRDDDSVVVRCADCDSIKFVFDKEDRL